MKKKVVIVGGGTAGWLTALYLAKNYSHYDLTIIDSSKIGILGAGEGGNLILKNFLIDEFKFDENEFINRVNGTKKFGIDFQGWNKNTNYSFVHGFKENGLLDTKFNSFHFDAQLFADYLKNKSKKFGIKIIDKEVVNFVDTNSCMSKIVFSDNTELDVDFVFDCSGFKRLIIGKKYKTDWVSFEDDLIVNSAVTFTIPINYISKVPTTIAKAEKYGWIWKIPLKNRWGCGYIFDKKYIDSDKIIDEIKLIFKDTKLEIGRKLDFEPGYFKNVWVNNSIAVGLSTGFLEPLEATSIMTTIIQLKKLPKNLFDFKNKKRYNQIIENFNIQNMLFIRHHYNCSRNDSLFWKEYKEKKLPIQLEKIYNNEYIHDVLGTIDNQIAFRDINYKHVYDNNFRDIKFV